MMIRRTSSILIFILILMMSIIVIPNMTENVSAGVFPLKVEVQPPSTQYVNVGPGQPAFTQLTFVVKNMGPNPLRKITTSVNFGPGATSVIASPAQFTLPTQGEQKVVAYVTVDRNIEAPTQVSVGITVTDDTGVSASDAGAVVINQFSFIVIDPVAPYQEIPPGTPFAYFFKIMNQGNGADPVRFEVVNEINLKDNGWTVIIPPTQQIPMKQFITVKVSGTTPRTWGWRSEFETITLKAISELKGVNYSQQYTVTVFLRGFFVPAFDPMFTIIAIAVVAGFISNNKSKKLPPDLNSEDGEELDGLSEKFDEVRKDSDQRTVENFEVSKTPPDTYYG